MSNALKEHFLFLYAVALSDLHVDPDELRFLYELGERRNIPSEEIDQLLLHPDRVDNALPDDLLERVEYLYEFALMVWADGKVTPEEREILHKLCLRFGFVQDNVEEIAGFLLEEAQKQIPVEDILSVVHETLAQ